MRHTVAAAGRLALQLLRCRPQHGHPPVGRPPAAVDTAAKLPTAITYSCSQLSLAAAYSDHSQLQTKALSEPTKSSSCSLRAGLTTDGLRLLLTAITCSCLLLLFTAAYNYQLQLLTVAAAHLTRRRKKGKTGRQTVRGGQAGGGMATAVMWCVLP